MRRRSMLGMLFGMPVAVVGGVSISAAKSVPAEPEANITLRVAASGAISIDELARELGLKIADGGHRGLVKAIRES